MMHSIQTLHTQFTSFAAHHGYAPSGSEQVPLQDPASGQGVPGQGAWHENVQFDDDDLDFTNFFSQTTPQPPFSPTGPFFPGQPPQGPL